MQKVEKGITLIALVITIIILLILAGITIGMLTGENGILTKAEKAKEEFLYSNAEEKVKLAILEYQAKMKKEELYSILEKIEGLEEIIEPDNMIEGIQYTVIVDGYMFDITDELEVIRKGKSSTIAPNVNMEEVERQEKETKILVQASTEDEGGIDKIILIKDGVEIETKKIDGTQKEVTDKFTITGNGTYQIKVIGKNRKTTMSDELEITGLVTISGTLKVTNVANGKILLTITGETREKNENIASVEIYDGDSLLKTIPIEGEKTNIEEQYPTDLPFYVPKSYRAKIVSNANKKVDTNVQATMNTNAILTVADLKKLSEIVSNGTNSFQNKWIYLENDINMGGQQLNAIGNDVHPFQGVFCGNRHTISNLTLGYTTQGKRGVGLFGHIDRSGCIRELLLENVKTPTNCDTIYLGSIVAKNYGLVDQCRCKVWCFKCHE